MEKQFLNIAPPCFLLQIPLSYPEWTANILFHVLLICTHTQRVMHGSAAHGGCHVSLLTKGRSLLMQVQPPHCILPWGTHVIDYTVHLRWAFRHNILVHFP